jgi:hypothetical protein
MARVLRRRRAMWGVWAAVWRAGLIAHAELRNVAEEVRRALRGTWREIVLRVLTMSIAAEGRCTGGEPGWASRREKRPHQKTCVSRILPNDTAKNTAEKNSITQTQISTLTKSADSGTKGFKREA